MKTIEIEIRGTAPLLIHRFGERSENGSGSRKVMVEDIDPRVEAEQNAYKAADGTFYFSAFAIMNAMACAGSNHKMKGSRKSLRFVVPSAVRMCSDTITILNCNGPAMSFEVDSRPVTIPATKGRIMRHRPRWNDWGAKFKLLLNEDMLPVKDASTLLTEAGNSIGVGDFRPEKRGPFGTFRITKFEEFEG